jgi:hypothetical protein
MGEAGMAILFVMEAEAVALVSATVAKEVECPVVEDLPGDVVDVERGLVAVAHQARAESMAAEYVLGRL